MRLAIDLDGVIFQFVDAYTELLTERTGIVFPKASDEWPPVWYFERAAGVNKEDELVVWSKIWEPGSMFWRFLHPLPGAAEAVSRLSQLAHRGHDVYFISNRAGDRAKVQTEKALYEIGMDYPTVLLTADKLPAVLSLSIDVFIDDRPETVLGLVEAAPDTRIYVQDRPYNRHVKHRYITRVHSVTEMLDKEGLYL